MQIVLSDHNCEGHAEALFEVLKFRGWLDMIPMKLLWFRDVGLSDRAGDEQVWLFGNLCPRWHKLLVCLGHKTARGA